LKILSQYHFPGNVRELENIIERSVAMELSTIILPESLALATYKSDSLASKDLPTFTLTTDGIDLDQTLDHVEKTLLLQALQKTMGNKQRAADLLKVNLRSLRYRMLKHGLEKE
jgi:two-component system, NtrC family, response regulator PilR